MMGTSSFIFGTIKSTTFKEPISRFGTNLNIGTIMGRNATRIDWKASNLSMIEATPLSSSSNTPQVKQDNIEDQNKLNPISPYIKALEESLAISSHRKEKQADKV